MSTVSATRIVVKITCLNSLDEASSRVCFPPNESFRNHFARQGLHPQAMMKMLSFSNFHVIERDSMGRSAQIPGVRTHREYAANRSRT